MAARARSDCRLACASPAAQDLLLECIARAAYEATEFAFDFSGATLELLDRRGKATVVKTDGDCRRIRGAAGLRVSTGRHARGLNGRAARTAGSLLYTGPGEEDEEEIDVVL